MSSQDQSSFLSLPLDLRLLIYTIYYKDTTVWVKLPDSKSRTSSTVVSLIQTCHQVRSEATPMFYDWTRFHVEGQLVQRGYTPSHSPDSEKRFCFALPRGIRVLEIPLACLKQVGYDVQDPGRWKIRRPFDQVRHLKVETEVVLDSWGQSQPRNLRQKKSKSTSNAGILKLMAEAWDRPSRLSIRILFSDSPFWTGRYVVYMEDPKQISTWTCGGWDPSTYYPQVCKFLKDWGLSRAQIKGVFMTCNRMGHKLTHEEYEQIRGSHKE